MSQQYGLGRGLASLIPPKKKPVSSEAGTSPFRDASSPQEKVIFEASPQVSPAPVKSSGVSNEVPTGNIVSNPHQPRLHFDPVKLEELAESIKEHGILQPLIVSRSGGASTVLGEANRTEQKYELIAGERRLQAAKKLGLETVPVVIRDVSEQQKLELAIIENIQRHNLNPIEEAKAYLQLIDEFGMQQESVAKKMGRSRSAVANTMRLLQLPIEIQRAVAEGKLSEGHAKALLSIENPEKQRAVFDLIVKDELTVRETETKVRSISVKPHIRTAMPLNPDILSRAEHLMQILGTKVKISPSGKGGKVVIEYYSAEDLDGLFRRLEE